MALSTSDKTRIRQETAKTQNVNYTKTQIDAASVAIEAQIQATCKAHINSAIEAAVPGVFSNAQKKKISAEVFFIMFIMDK